MGGGFAIAMACDFRLCAESATFGVPVARTLGNCLSMENLARLVDVVGAARASDLMMTGRLVSADEALEWGLATRALPVGELDAETRAFALELAGRATSTISATKHMLLPLTRAPAASRRVVRRPRGRVLRQRRVSGRRRGIRRTAQAEV